MEGLLDFSDNPRRRLMASGGMDAMLPDAVYGGPQPVMAPPSLVDRIYGTADAYSGGLLSGLDNFVHRDVLGRDVDFRKTAEHGRTGVPRDFLSASQIPNPARAVSSAISSMPELAAAIVPGIKAASAAASSSRSPLTKMLLSDHRGSVGAALEAAENMFDMARSQRGQVARDDLEMARAAVNELRLMRSRGLSRVDAPRY